MTIESKKNLNMILIKIQHFIMISCSVLISGMIFLGTIMRYVFKTDFYGLEELVMILAFWLYFIGGAVASHEDSHINADLLSSFVHGEKGKNILKIIKYGGTLVIGLLMTVWGYDFIMWSVKLNPKTPVYKLPLLLSQIPLFISFLLMNIYTLGYLIKTISEVKSSNKEI